jgi:hypothetical protein
MKPPGSYIKGAAHQPVITVAGHFNGMHPCMHGNVPVTSEMWFRGDDHADVIIERDRYREGLREIVALFDKEDVEMLDFLEVAERALK